MKPKSIADVLAKVTDARIYAQGSYTPPGKKPPRRETRARLQFTMGDEKAEAPWTAATPALIYSGLPLDPGDRVTIEITVTPAKEVRRHG